MYVRQIFKDLQVGDVIYHINPFACGVQTDVEIKTIVVEDIERSFLFGMFGEDIVYFSGDGSRNDRMFLNDMDYGCKFTTTCLKDAQAYLENVHEGFFSHEVSLHHEAVLAQYR
ncbi:hypothetical protein NVP1081O_186 [Vibrio phage 1.081.O._10N.286.52.C2]|nr:hypothetical protein NVP1081O_186 [Vibrio phage 1.081.O._10N.286.52.C2]